MSDKLGILPMILAAAGLIIDGFLLFRPIGAANRQISPWPMQIVGGLTSLVAISTIWPAAVYFQQHRYFLSLMSVLFIVLATGLLIFTFVGSRATSRAGNGVAKWLDSLNSKDHLIHKTAYCVAFAGVIIEIALRGGFVELLARTFN